METTKKNTNIAIDFIKIYFEKIVLRLKKIYTNKLIIWKLLIFFIVGFSVLFSSFSVRHAMLNATSDSWTLIPGFLNIKIVENTGIAFSGLSSSSSSLVYFVQSIPIIIGGITFIFSTSLYLDFGISLLFFGGMSNIVDRSITDYYTNLNHLNNDNIYHAVVDYLEFNSNFINNFAVFNLPDVYVIFGVIVVAVIIIIISWIKEYRQEKNNSKNEPIKTNIINEEKK